MVDRQRDEHVEREQRTRRPYKRPELKEYGPVSKLTTGTSGSQSERGIGQRKSSCL